MDLRAKQAAGQVRKKLLVEEVAARTSEKRKKRDMRKK